MKFPVFLTTIISILLLNAAHADTLLGIYAGAGTWQQEFSGDVNSSFADVSVEDDLGIDDDDNTVAYIALEHGVPILPNIRAQHFSIDVEGDNVLSRAIEFNGQTFALAEAISTNVELRQTDAVFYYELLDNVVSLDLGLAVSLVEGRIDVVSSTLSASADFEEILPMVYAKARADLPLSGLWIGASGQGMAYDGNSITEFNAQIGWESDIGLGFEAGWRSVALDLEEFDQVSTAEIEVSGPYAALNYYF